MCRAPVPKHTRGKNDVTGESDLRAFGRPLPLGGSTSGSTLQAHLLCPSREGDWRLMPVSDNNLMGPFMAARLGSRVSAAARRHPHQYGRAGRSPAFVPAYVVSKFGLRGSRAVRADVADIPGISVTTMLPYTLDTPHFQDAANATGKRAHALPPVQEPEKVARAIVDVVIRPRRQRYVPRYVSAGVALHWLWPRARAAHSSCLRTFTRRPQEYGGTFSPANAAASSRHSSPVDWPNALRAGFAVAVA